jgi:hypothetical protein
MYNIHHFLYNILIFKGKLLQINYIVGGLKMRKAIILSLALICIGAAAGFFENDWYLTVRICGISGLACLTISTFLNGTFNGFIKGPSISSGRHISPPFLDTEDNPLRDKITNLLLIIGGPSVIVAIVIYVLTNKK